MDIYIFFDDESQKSTTTLFVLKEGEVLPEGVDGDHMKFLAENRWFSQEITLQEKEKKNASLRHYYGPGRDMEINISGPGVDKMFLIIGHVRYPFSLEGKWMTYVLEDIEFITKDEFEGKVENR